jgi:hypothetical protein
MTMTYPPSRFRAGLAVTIAPLLLPLAGCAAILGNQVKAEKKELRSFAVAAAPSVIVETFNGGIHVQAITENKVEAIVTKVGSGANKEAAAADLENVKVDFTQQGETIKIVAKRTVPKPFGSSGASVDLKVPARAALSLTTQNGEIAATGAFREAIARSSNGNIEIHGAKGKLDLTTNNGTIDVDASEAIVTAETSNGNVAFTGTLSKGSHSMQTSNGSIELTLPATSQFQFAASTSNGSVTNRFPGLQTKSGKSGSNRLTGLIGSGSGADVDLILETSNGTITIEPAQQAEASKL